MRYISQVEILKDELAPVKNPNGLIEFRKDECAARLGDLQKEVIGFEKEERDTVERYTIEIESFAQKDWVQFKQEISDHILKTFPEGRATYELFQFKTMFDRLENIGREKSNEINNKKQ